MVWDLRDAPLGGFCGWRIEQLSVHAYPRRHALRGDLVLRMTPSALRTPEDNRPWWDAGPMQVHCTRTGDELKCSDAVDAIHDIEPEGHYELNIEVGDAPPGGGR